MRSKWFKPSLILSLIAAFTAVACGTGSTQSAGSVKVMAVWSGKEQADFMAVLKPFEDKTGIKVNYQSSLDEDATLTARVAAGNPPDVAAAPSQQLLAAFARQGKVVALNSAVDMTALQANYAKGWIDLGEPLRDGKLYQVFSWAAVKGLIWYDPRNFQANGYSVPRSWDDLMALQSQIKASGTAPWCIALGSGSPSDRPGSDWIAEIVLSQSGPDVYDKWAAGTQKWTSPEITKAFQTWGSVIGTNNGNVYGGKQFMLATDFADGGKPMFDSPPKCYLHNQASFFTTFFTSANPALKPVTDFNFFPLPDLNRAYAGARVVAGDSWSMFHDTPQARKLIQYLTTAEAQAIWVRLGGKISPNKQTSIEAYPDGLSKETAQILTSTQVGRYGATDNMPADMKAAAWKAVLDYVSNQNGLQSILNGLDKVQAKAYAT